MPHPLRVRPFPATLYFVLLCTLASGSVAQGWVQRSLVVVPSARNSHAMGYEPNRGVTTMFGGFAGGNLALGDTWEWDGLAWTQKSPAVSPSARWGHAMAFDARRARLVLFGGFVPNVGFVSDTWEWDGVSWLQRLPAQSPAPRGYVAMAYDAVRARTVVFGGIGGGQAVLGDTWEWDGTQWMQAATTGPVARRGAAMAFDDIRANCVLFGGSDAQQAFGDTWTYDGNGWQQRTILNAPSPRQEARMEHDLACGSTVLHGGADWNFTTNFGDTWTWSGTSWTQLSASSPSPRHGAAMAFDGQRSQLTLFGGRNTAGVLADSWELASPCSRTVSIVPAPLTGQTSTFRYSFPSSAVGHFYSHLLTLHESGAQPITIPGFTSLGLERVDLFQIFIQISGFLAGGSDVSWSASIPFDRNFVGFPFDFQSIDVDLRTNTVHWSGNEVEVVIGAGTVELTELFSSGANRDANASGGAWSNGAFASPLGGDGRHGAFDITNGIDLGGGVWQWNVDNFTIPAAQTLSGASQVVTDGKFYFTEFTLLAGQTLRFTGVSPVQIFVRGNAVVDGRIQANGADQVNFQCRNTISTQPSNPVAGQQGSLGGPGGARGGQGGDRCLGVGATSSNNGRNGQDLLLPAGHAYAANAVGTGGRGSPIHPAHGLDASLLTPVNTYTTTGIFNSNVALGGSGGGFATSGSIATNLPVVPTVVQILPSSAVPGGLAFNPLPLPASNPSSLSQFLIGGSGGGGGGSHPFLALSAAVFSYERWKAGGGGTGGGGAIAMRAGGNINLGSSGVIEAKGGRGVRINGDNPSSPTQDSVNSPNGAHWGIPAPGGGGSGGSVLLQASRDLVAGGAIDAAGGTGSFTDGILPNSVTSSLDIDNRGGNGAAGFYRIEAAGVVNAAGLVGTPALILSNNVAALRATDRDAASGCRSLWRNANVPTPPLWSRYEMSVDLDGNGSVDRVYSDDPSLPGAFGPANDPLGPVMVRFQGARLDALGVPIAGTVGPWRSFVGSAFGAGLGADSAMAFRFDLVFQTASFPNCVVRQLKVVIQ